MSDSPAATTRRTVSIDRTFAAPREVVFKAFTDPEQMARWWGPEGFEVPADKIHVDLRIGGRFDLVMVLVSQEIAAGMGVEPGTEFPDRSEIAELEPPSLLVLRSEPQPELGLVESTATRIEFHEEGETRTRMILTGGPYSEEMAGHAETGWSQSFGKLDRLLA